jgi:phytol kinase
MAAMAAGFWFKIRLMVKILASLFGVFIILVISELLYKRKMLMVEDRRKFVHILSGCFIAFWPWWMSWLAIELIGLAVVLGVAINRKYDIFKFSKNIRRETYGEYFFGLAMTICALIAHNRMFFAIAILVMALADGFAALAGKHFGQKSRYKVFGYTKTITGTLTFWFTSVCVLAVGVLFAHDYIPLLGYYWLVLVLPPVLALVENVFVWGLDDLATPIIVVIALRMAQA